MFVEAIRIDLEERFRYAFGIELKELIKMGRDRARVEVYSRCAKVKLAIGDRVYVEELDLCIDDMLKNLEIKASGEGILYVKLFNWEQRG